jgi:hypothetical protein
MGLDPYLWLTDPDSEHRGKRKQMVGDFGFAEYWLHQHTSLLTWWMISVGPVWSSLEMFLLSVASALCFSSV